MGCVQSRKDINDVHPNVFRVINVDECHVGLWAGQLEVTDTELVLYRRGKVPTKWPLRSLRRYGFDGDIFSFESGRRCETGEGIYAFKCRRAEQLFNTLQQCIQVRNMNPDSALETLASEGARPPGTLPRPPPDPPHPDYLEPAPPLPPTSPAPPALPPASVRLGSVSSGPLSPEVHSPGSPSSTDILEVMALAPLPPPCPQVSNIYQVRDFPLHREHNNNKKVVAGSADHSYSNTGDINTVLATLRHSFQNCPQGDDLSVQAEEAIMDQRDSAAPLSPSHSTASEHYATLAMDAQTDDRVYMNLAPGEIAQALPILRENFHINNLRSNSLNVQTPHSAAQISKLNDHFSFVDRVEMDEEQHNYANLGATEVKFDPRVISRHSKMTRGVSLDTPPVLEENHDKIRYAILDLHSSKTEVDTDIACALPPPGSPKEPVEGYTLIDFKKTGALKSVASEMEMSSEGLRKTRHNSTAQPPDPTVT